MSRNSLLIGLCLVLFSPAWLGGLVPGQSGTVQVEFKKCWQFSEPDTEFVTLSSDGNAAFLSTEDARLTSVSLKSGTKLWSSELGGVTTSNLTVVGARIYFVTTKGSGTESSAVLKVVGKETGIFAKELALMRADRYFLQAEDGNLILVSSEGDIYSINTATDSIVWHRKPTGSIVGKPYIGEGLVAVSSGDNNLIRIDSKTGEISLTKKVASTPSIVFALKNGDLFYGDNAGRLYSVAGEWTLRLGAQVSDVFELDGSLIVTSFDNFVYRVNAADGDVRWRKRLAGRVAGTAMTAEKALLIFTLGESTAILTDFKKGRTIGQMSIGEAVEAVIIPPTFASGEAVSVNGDVLSFTTAACDTKKASATSANASVRP
jgi:outer membrane protein assembly factor BamB